MNRLISIVFSTLLCVSAFAYSDAELDSISQQFNINEVTITAKALEKDVIIPQTLKGDALTRMNSLSVADAIRYFAGVQIKDYGGVGGIKTIDIRSMGTNHMGVYYNGIQLGNAQNGQIDLGKFSLENIEEILLYNGQKSDIFQSAREFGSAGSIYLNSRRPKFKEGEHFHAKAQMRCGSFALVNPSVSVDIKLSENMSANVNAELVSSNGQYKFRYRRVTPSGDIAYDTTAIRQNGDINAIRVEGALNHYYSNQGFWKLQLYHYNSERGVPGAIVNNVWRNGERLWDRNSFVQASWQDTYFKIWNIKANFKYAADYTRYLNNDDKLVHVENEYLQQETYFTIANKVELFKWWDVSLAYDFQWNGLSKYMDARRFTHWLSLATAFNIQDYLRIQASILGTFISNTKGEAKENKSNYKFTPAIFLSYRPTQLFDLRLNAFYKQSYRYPTFNDLYYTDMGNATLKPELAKQRNVGISYDLPFRLNGVNSQMPSSSFHISADYYYNKVQDKIIAYPKGQQFRWTMLNLGVVKINGLDLASQLQFVLPHDFTFGVKLQYTYQTAIDVTDKNDTYYGHQIPYIPWHSGSAIGMLSWRNYSLNYSFIYVGERYNQQENIIYNYSQPWYTHDISLHGQWSIVPKKSQFDNAATLQNQTKSAQPIVLKSAIEINNLLSQDYDVIANYPMPKCNFRITFSVAY